MLIFGFVSGLFLTYCCWIDVLIVLMTSFCSCLVTFGKKKKSLCCNFLEFVFLSFIAFSDVVRTFSGRIWGRRQVDSFWLVVSIPCKRTLLVKMISLICSLKGLFWPFSSISSLHTFEFSLSCWKWKMTDRKGIETSKLLSKPVVIYWLYQVSKAI